MNAPIEFHDVHRWFGEHDVLRGLSLQIEPGQIFALLGRNGAGKTTALRIALGFLEPMRGHVRVLGTDSRCLAPSDRERIGYVSEGHRLYKTMSVSQAVDFEAGTRPRFDRRQAEEAIGRCGLPGNKFIGLLSRGQRAQLALILAVAGRPDVLIFDDPAMGLDVVMRREFLDVMIDMLSQGGCSVLFSSHILTDVERIADRVGILHDGRLIVDATLDDLRRRVQKRHWVAHNGSPSHPPEVPSLLRVRPLTQGFDLTLVDVQPDHEAALRENAAVLTEPSVPSLEDLFLDLTTMDPSAEEVGR